MQKTLLISGLLYTTTLTFAQKTLSGFSVSNQAKQEKIEQEYRTKQSAERYKTHLQKLTSVPHLAGTPENEKVRDYIADVMRKHPQVWVYADEIYSRLAYAGAFDSLATRPLPPSFAR